MVSKTIHIKGENNMKWYEKKDSVNVGKDQYLNLKSGQSAEIIFLGEPFFYYTVYGEKPYTEYMKPEKEGAKFQFRINVYNIVNSEIKVLRGGNGLLRTIKENLLEQGQDSIFKIKRDGDGIDTRWHMFFKSKINEEQKKVLIDKPLIDIGHRIEDINEPKINSVNNNVKVLKDDDIPF